MSWLCRTRGKSSVTWKPRHNLLMILNRRTALILLGMVVAIVTVTVAGTARARKRPSMPRIAQPVLFGTPEADLILSALQVFPPENPWNQEIAGLPVQSNSARII